MLETVREYGRRRLAEDAAPCLLGPDQAVWLARLAREHDTLRAALEDYRAQEAARRGAGGSDPGLRFANTLRQFWDMYGHYSEGRRWLQTLLGQGLGTTAARGFYEQALALFRQAEDMRGIADALNNLGIVAWTEDDYDRAQALYEESLAVDRALGDTYSIACALGNLGVAHYEDGDDQAAPSCCVESLALHRELGQRDGIVTTLSYLGVAHYEDRDDQAAPSCCVESLALYRELGQRDGIVTTLSYLGRVAARSGDLARAWALHQEALRHGQEIGEKGASPIRSAI